MLKELPLMADIANTALFLASGLASKITGVTVDLTCGTTAALNYKVTPMAFVEDDRRDERGFVTPSPPPSLQIYPLCDSGVR